MSLCFHSKRKQTATCSILTVGISLEHRRAGGINYMFGSRNTGGLRTYTPIYLLAMVLVKLQCELLYVW